MNPPDQPQNATPAEPLPCPFCGATPAAFESKSAPFYEWQVECLCGGNSGTFVASTAEGARDNAIANWNTRTPSVPTAATEGMGPLSPEQIAELTAGVDECRARVSKMTSEERFALTDRFRRPLPAAHKKEGEAFPVAATLEETHESAAPETDAFVSRLFHAGWPVEQRICVSDFARPLEHRISALTRAVESLQRERDEQDSEECQLCKQYADEVDALRQQVETLKGWNDRMRKALRGAGDCFRRIEDTRFGYDGDCGTKGIANEGSEIVSTAHSELRALKGEG